MERRYIKSELRVAQADEAAPKIVGYAAVFNSASDPDLPWKESIDPHAFDDVLATGPDVRCLWNHNEDHVLGRTKAGTLRLSTDARGLHFECDPPDTQVARDLMTSMKRGDIDQSSYGYIVGDDDWSEDADGNVIRRINSIQRLLDVSPVTTPAFPEATSGVRSLPESMPVEYRSKFAADKQPNPKEKTQTDKEGRALIPDQCICTCSQCRAGQCGICSADPQCEGAERNSFTDWREKTAFELSL